MKKKLYDGFCGAGGSAMGYWQAGFDVLGTDIKHQKRYPFTFVQEDTLLHLKKHGHEYDLIHLSPPCQAHSSLRHAYGREYPEFIAECRDIVEWLKRPYIIENVVGSPLIGPIMLCGTMFDLRVFRHRLFESNLSLITPEHISHKKLGLKAPRTGRRPKDGEVWSPYGNFSGVKECGKALGWDWMIGKEMSQAIPPAYTYYLGKQALALI